MKNAYYGKLHNNDAPEPHTGSVEVYPTDDPKNLFQRITNYKMEHALTWDEIERIFSEGCNEVGAWEFPHES